MAGGREVAPASRRPALQDSLISRYCRLRIAEQELGEEAQPTMTANSFGSRATLDAGGATHEIYRLAAVDGSESLPYSLKVLLENLLRNEDGLNITADHIRALAGWDPQAEPDTEIQFTPARVILQDLTGVAAVVDLATMREAVADLGGDPKKSKPLI